MKTILGFISWLNGLIWASGTQTGNASTQTAASLVTAQWNRPGTQYKFDSSLGTQGFSMSASSLGLGGANEGDHIARVYWGVVALPGAGDHAVALQFSQGSTFTTNGAVIRLRSDGFFEAGFLDVTNEVQRLTHSATGGTFTLTFTGQTTAAIAWNASAATIQAALEALSNIDPGDVIVTGGPLGTAVNVEFAGQYKGVNVAALTADNTLLTGGTHTVTIVTTTTGGGANGRFWNGPLASGSQVAAQAIAAGEFVRIDAYLDVTGTTWRLKWQFERIDGLTGLGLGVHVQTDATWAGQTATTWQNVGCHFEGGDGPTGTQVAYSADLAIETDPTQYPIGPGRSLLLKVTGFGTNVGPTQFTEDDGSAIDSSSWHNVADSVPPFQNAVSEATANDGLSLRLQSPFVSTNLLEFVFTQLSVADVPSSTDIICVEAWVMIYGSATFPTAVGNLDFWQGGGLLRGAATSTSNTNVRAFPWGTSGNFLRAITAPAGGWTLAKLNGLSAKWYGTTGGGAAPRYHGLAALLVDVHLSATSEERLYSSDGPGETWGTIAA